MNLKDMILSKSKIMSYLTCPLRFKYEYVDNIKYESPPHFIRGKTFHQFAELFWNSLDWNGNGDWDVSVPNIPDNDLKQMIQNFVGFEKKRWAFCKSNTKDPKKYFIPVMKERPIEVPQLKIHGIVDRVDLDFDNELVVVEYKTGEFNPKYVSSIRKELSFYKILLDGAKLFDKEIMYAGCYYPKPNKIFFEKISTRSVNLLWKDIDDIRDGLDKQKFDPTPGVLCAWCPFVRWCSWGEKPDASVPNM